MRKYIFLTFSMLVLAISANAQNNNNPFAGLTFRIDNYIGDKFDNSEDLIFTEQEVEGSICVQYGFGKAKYTTTKNDRGLYEFSCTMTSSKHGKMVWTGVKKGEKISGKYMWTKAGQDPIHYTFKGKLK